MSNEKPTNLGKFNSNRFAETRVGKKTITNPSTTDGLANVGESVISFFHVPSERDIFFKAFINSFNETYSSNYNSEEVFGRNDPIYTFRNTTRTIDISWKIPAETISEAYENLSRVQELAQFLYPTYKDLKNALTLSQSPAVRLKVMNLAQASTPSAGTPALKADNELTLYKSSNDPSQGILGFITSMNIRHNLQDPQAGVIQISENTILPKMIEVDISFSVVHETPLGYKKKGMQQKFQSPQFPYNASRAHPDQDLLGPRADRAATYDERQNFLTAQESKREQTEQDRANAMARNYDGLRGQKRLVDDRAFAKDEKNKGKRNYDYISSAVRGQSHVEKEINNIENDSPLDEETINDHVN